MKNIARVYIILSFFVYIISSSIVYMIAKDIYNKISDKKIEKIKSSFGNLVLKQLNETKINKELSTIDTEYIRLKIRNKNYLKAFNMIIIDFNKEEENPQYTKIYMENFEDIVLENLKRNSKKDETIKSYEAVLLGEYRLSNFQISKFLFECLKSKSMYLRVSSLKSISKIGNINNFMEALLYISDKDKYVDRKICIDILNQFGERQSILNDKLIEKFDLFNESIQKIIVEHFKNNKVTDAKEKLIDTLKSKECKKEIRISIIKYFSVIKNKDAKAEIIKILGEEDWEYRAVCVSALGSYIDEESKEILLSSISDKNWHVRYNSAISIMKFDDEEILDVILEKNDKYSTDIFFYAMFMNDEISYEEYLQNINTVGAESIC